MKPKGIVIIKKEFKATKIWPNKFFNLATGEEINLEQEYKEALAGEPVHVIDIAVDGSGYLVHGVGKKCGHFLWMIEKEDTLIFLPVYKENGMLKPVFDNPIKEFIYDAKTNIFDMLKAQGIELPFQEVSGLVDLVFSKLK